MKKRICDRCGEDIPAKSPYYKIFMVNFNEGKQSIDYKGDNCLLCGGGTG